MIQINVSPNWATINGLDPTRLSDLIYNAPEPPFRQGDARWLRSGSANLLYLHEQLPEANWNDPHNRLYEARAMRFLARLRDKPPSEEDLAWGFKRACDPWQIPIFAYGRRLRSIALAPVALGTGKSKMAIDIAVSKWEEGEIDGVIVIAPNGVHRQWHTKQIPRDMPDRVPYLGHVWKPTTKIPKNWPLPKAEALRRMRWMYFNVEAFSTESGKAAGVVRQILASGRWMIIVDESTRIKNGRATRTKVICRLGRGAVVRMILTGTPVTKGYEDFYTQFAFLDPEIIGMASWTAFRNRYCVTIPAYRGAAQGAVRIVGYKNQEELFRKLAPFTFMVPSSVLGLGDPRRERIEVELTAEQREIYHMMAHRLVADMIDRRIERPQNVLVELLRLQQVLCGWVHEPAIDEEGLETTIARRIPSNRIAALKSVLDDNDGQAVIWARFQHDIDDIAELLTVKPTKEVPNPVQDFVVYDGRVTNVAEREARVDRFSRGEVSKFVGNQAAGGTGIDGLQELCSFAVYYSNSYNREHRWQSEGRIYRRGQKHGVTYGDLVVPGTVDELFLQSYAETEDLARRVLENPSMLTGGLA